LRFRFPGSRRHQTLRTHSFILATILHEGPGLAYRFDGVQRTRTLGVYPDTRLARARVLREEVKGMSVMDGLVSKPDLI
jgi:hypothetical protein